jgi:hypothetical protein
LSLSILYGLPSGVIPFLRVSLWRFIVRRSVLFGVVVCLLTVIGPAAFSQSVTGQISGVVVDPAGAVVPGATVQLIHDLSQNARQFTTESTGSFIFTGLVPGTYSLRVSRAGFKTYDQRAIPVAAQERVDLHEVQLVIGEVSATVEVAASTVHVATDSSDRSIAIGLQQILDTPTRGRNPLNVIMTLPGVQTVASNDYRGWNGGGIPGVNGGQQGQIILNIDGAASQDSGNLNPGYLSPSMDAVSEVKLLTSNYTAEYGGRTAGQLTLSTKNGTPTFHGSLYYYWRHESFNANTFFNNKTNVVRPRYRYQNPGGTIGGPLIIPGTRFNKSRQKLFFFFSYDKLLNNTVGLATFTMPTAAERIGDYSKTVTTTGAQVPIFDPLTQAVFPGNVIPTTRISPQGQAMLNLFPQPDALGLALDPTGNRGYNFRYPFQQLRPLDDKILRIDYNPSPKWMTYARLLQDYQAQNGYGNPVTVGPPGGAWGQFPVSYHVQAVGAIGTVVYTFSPNLINEFSWGLNRGKQGVDPMTDTSSNKNNGGARTYQDSLLPLKDSNGNALTLPRINQASNVLGLLPAVSFGFPSTGFSAQSSGQGVTAAPTFSNDSRWPFTGTDQLQTIQDKITWVKGPHTLKAGFYYERMARNVSVYSVYNAAGTYYFGSDRANPVDTNYPYSNALLGSIFAYGDDSTKLVNHAHYTQMEWYLQDTWKVSRRLTLDYGLRFHRVGDLNSQRNHLGLFATSAYDASKAGQLLYPACSAPSATTCATANRIAVNPVTGATFPYVRQGTFDTSSYPANGYPWTGIQYYDTHFFNVAPIQLGPRLGFAWDVFGDGKTAMRGGFGITVGRNWNVDWIGALSAGQGPLMVPPYFLSPTIVYTSFQGLAGSQSYYTPQNLIGGDPNDKPQKTYNWSFGIQRDLGRGMILEVSYVGNALKNGYGQTYDFNAVPPLTTWKPSGCANPISGGCPQSQFVDPTTNPTNPGFYSTNLIRQMIGYKSVGNIILYTQGYTNNYNSLQVQVNRRTGHIQWNWNYTFSRTIVFNNVSTNGTGALFQFVDADLMKNVANRRHAFNFNFGYDFPTVSQRFSGDATKKVSKALLDGWHLNGNGAVYAGTPYTVGCGATGQPSQYWVGTPTAYLPFRCQMGSSIFLTDGSLPSKTEDPRLQVPLNAANFQLPPANSWGIGNTPMTLFYGPWMWNLDFSLAKMTTIREGKTLELRVETFNTLNHFNPNNPNTSLTWNFSTGAQTNAAFGTIQGAQVDPRRVVLSGRFRF